MTAHDDKVAAEHDAAAAAAQQDAGGGGWSEFWESIEEQRAAFAAEASDYASRLAATGVCTKDHDVLDFGCGFGYVARFVAPRVGRLSLWDGSSSVLRQARRYLADVPNVRFADFAVADRLGEYSQSFDRILAHSVVQYMDIPEFERWLARWVKMLKPRGQIILSDLLQPEVGFVREAASIARFFWQQGIFWEVAGDKLRRAKSYLATRKRRRLTLVTPQVLERLARDNGLDVRVLPENLSYRSSRLSAVFSVRG